MAIALVSTQREESQTFLIAKRNADHKLKNWKQYKFGLFLSYLSAKTLRRVIEKYQYVLVTINVKQLTDLIICNNVFIGCKFVSQDCKHPKDIAYMLTL